MPLTFQRAQGDIRLESSTNRRTGARVLDIPAALIGLERYPALKYSRAELLAVAGQPQPSNARLVGAIESDVTLTAHVLRAANEKTGGVRRRSTAVLGIPQAVQELTLGELVAIADEAPHVGFFAHTDTISPERFRVHAIATRKAAQAIMHVCRPAVRADDAYALAILHDIGKLVMALIQTHYDASAAIVSPAQTFMRERRALSLDHATAGALLATRWGLPEALSEAIATHHTPGANRLSDVVCLADLLAHHAQGAELIPDELSAACRPLGLGPAQVARLIYQVSADPTDRVVAEACPLSRRQLVAVRALSDGKSYKEIATELGVSASTIRTHLHNTYRKLGVSDRAQAVLLARGRGWL